VRRGFALALAVASCRASPAPPLARDAGAFTAPADATAAMEAGDLPPGPAAPAPPSRLRSLVVETPSGAPRPRFRKTSLTADDLAELVGASPELARVGGEVAFFDVGDRQFLARSKADRGGVSFTTLPLVWMPEPGTDLLVITGRGKAGSFVAAWRLLPGGELRLASTFVLLGEVAPVALAYRAEEPSLWWTTCWQCPGETGHVTLREDHGVVIVQD